MTKIKEEIKFSTDKLATMTVASLIRDFRSNLVDPSFCCKLMSAVKTGDIGKIREAVPTPTYTEDPATFKAIYQLQSVLKRHRYEYDIYSEQELQDKAINTFLETQARIRRFSSSSMQASVRAVVAGARIYIAQVLGVYDEEEHRQSCRFGRRASVGITARDACEGARWELPLSGSHEQIAWFDSEMSQVAAVQEYWQKQRKGRPELEGKSNYHAVSSLKLVLVPKTFKSLRAIMPNTTIGSYMTYGLGEMLRKRLKRVGYDIRTLQTRHRVLARQGSVHNLTATVDLSSASDSISVHLVDLLFPSDWRDILHKSRIGRVELPDGRRVESETFSTMGVGYTFPLQTLVFLAVLKSVEALLFASNDKRTISVYGDDMIFFTRQHKWSVYYLEQLGFVVNIDKSFHDGPFRESCGGDYYRGVDVRPFQPQNDQALVSPKGYEAVLYKYINGLLMRWSEYEVEGTLNFLTSEIEFAAGKVKLVPPDFPDDSGIRSTIPLSYQFLRRCECSHPKSLGHGNFRFSYLTIRTETRKEERHEPYLWLALNGGPGREYHYSSSSHHESDGPLERYLNRCVFEAITRNPVLKNRTEIQPDGPSFKVGPRYSRKVAHVTVSHTGRYTRQSGVSCFGTRSQTFA